MKKRIKSILIILFLSNIIVAQTTIDYSILKGPYLGQKPPGLTPEIFAPDIVSLPQTSGWSSSLFPDGNNFYFQRLHFYPKI